MTVQINDSFFDELGKSSGIVAVCQQTAEAIAAKARGSAPVDTGAYRDSIRVERARRPGRVVFLVVAGDPGAMGIESRTGNLARAAR